MPSRTMRILGATVLACVFMIVACEATFKGKAVADPRSGQEMTAP